MVQTGIAEIVPPGSNITVITHKIVAYVPEAAFKAAGELGDSAEIDLLTVRPWDKQTSVGSRNEINRCLVVQSPASRSRKHAS